MFFVGRSNRFNRATRWEPSQQYPGLLSADVDTHICDYCAGVEGAQIQHNNGGDYDSAVRFFTRPDDDRVWAAFTTSYEDGCCPICDSLGNRREHSRRRSCYPNIGEAASLARYVGLEIPAPSDRTGS